MDEQIWFYIIAAVIYFLTRGKKKKQNQKPAPNQRAQRPTESSRPQQTQRPVSFEDLLKEITEAREEEPAKEIVVEESEPVKVERVLREEKKTRRERHFADDESRRIYEESIARAQEHEPGHDHKFEPDDDYVSRKMFKTGEKAEPTFADKIRESLQSKEDAKKAIIYSEILSKKY